MRAVYGALQLRQEAREELEKAKKEMEKQMGINLTYSQFITIVCQNLLSDSKKGDE